MVGKMMKCEFEELIGKSVSDLDYKSIEYVYSFHPSIDEVDGKKKIATLYSIGGMRLIKDMIETARVAARLTNLIHKLNIVVDRTREALCDLSKGNTPDIDIDAIEKIICI